MCVPEVNDFSKVRLVFQSTCKCKMFLNFQTCFGNAAAARDWACWMKVVTEPLGLLLTSSQFQLLECRVALHNCFCPLNSWVWSIFWWRDVGKYNFAMSGLCVSGMKDAGGAKCALVPSMDWSMVLERGACCSAVLNLPLELSILCHSFIPSLAASPNVDAFQPVQCWMSDLWAKSLAFQS